MASLVISGDTSGSITVAAPAVAGSNTQTLAAVTGTLAPVVSGTAVASTSGTSVDFTGIPSWAKRITVMFAGVSTNGSSVIQIQIGSTTFTTSGYSSTGLTTSLTTLNSTTYTTGFGLSLNSAAAAAYTGVVTLVLQTSNTWVGTGSGQSIGANSTWATFGFAPNLAGALDRVRITTVNGTDTFDAGTINILFE